jgi:hypothetical protein
MIARKGGGAAISAPAAAQYETYEEISRLIHLRELAFILLPDGEVRQNIRSEIGQLRRREAARKRAAAQAEDFSEA